jgi:ATP-binding cassette subfamily B protein
MNPLLKLLPYMKPYWKRALLSLVLLSTLVVMDLSIPRLIQRIIDEGIAKHNQPLVLHTALLMLAISLVSTLIALGNNLFSIQVGEGAARDIRQALFEKIQTFSYGNLDRLKTGQLMVRLTSDINALKSLIQVSLRIGTRAPLLMIGSLILMIHTSQSLALILLPLLLISSAAIAFFIFKTEPLFRIVQQRLDRLNTVLQENIAGVRLVKAFVRADFENQRFETANEDLTAGSVRVMQFMSSMGPALTVFVNIGIVIVIWAGGRQAIRGQLSLGQLVAFTNYLLTTMVPLIMMTMLSNTWASGLVSARRLNEVLDSPLEIKERPGALPLPSSPQVRIVFDHVTFHYNGGSDEAVLKEISFIAEPGQTVAVLGATGSGKSTLINLVPRFYDVSSGQVLINGLDIRGLQQDSLLAQIGIVPQETILFSGTVADNIRYGRPDAGDEEVKAAAQAAQAHDFILELPQGYQSPVTARGMNFSGGQKQRLAIARALLTRPKVLILDDSTSSVDVETETKIQEALQTLNPQCIRLVVAQRISTVLKADQILVLDKGRLVARGKHAELLTSSPIYREIYDSQLGAGSHPQETYAEPNPA